MTRLTGISMDRKAVSFADGLVQSVGPKANRYRKSSRLARFFFFFPLLSLLHKAA
jgi:hypothetical protein